MDTPKTAFQLWMEEHDDPTIPTTHHPVMMETRNQPGFADFSYRNNPYREPEGVVRHAVEGPSTPAEGGPKGSSVTAFASTSPPVCDPAAEMAPATAEKGIVPSSTSHLPPVPLPKKT